MPYLSKSDLNNIVGSSRKSVRFSKAATDAVLEQSASKKVYDIFLSHSYSDKETVLQVNYLLEEQFGLDVFVDWIEAPELDRSSTSPSTAAKMRDVMDRCSSLLFVISTTSSDSKWMPWELGYSDAKHGRVAVLPIADSDAVVAAYRRQEFVGMYPYIDFQTKSNDRSGSRYLWVNDPQYSDRYAEFSNWLYSGELPKH